MSKIHDDHIKSFFQYDHKDGKITRSDRKNSTGSIDYYGYLILKIKSEQYKAHRVAWFLFYGEWPGNVIDHINGDKLDNRIVNLRDVSQAENVRSTVRKQNKETGVVGVHVDRSTNGLLAKYTTKYGGKHYRFRSLSEAVKFRREKGMRI